MDDPISRLSNGLVHRPGGVLRGLGRFLRGASPSGLVVNELLDGVSDGFGRVDHILRSDCVPVVVFCELDGGGSTWDFEGEELVVRLVLERDESAADVEGGSCTGGVQDKFSDGVTFLWCRRSGGQTLNKLCNQQMWTLDVRVGGLLSNENADVQRASKTVRLTL